MKGARILISSTTSCVIEEEFVARPQSSANSSSKSPSVISVSLRAATVELAATRASKIPARKVAESVAVVRECGVTWLSVVKEKDIDMIKRAMKKVSW